MLVVACLGNEMAERMAYFGLSVNMVVFMFYIMHRPFASSANAVNNFLGISQASSVLGGFLADAYLGRYWTIAIFTTIYLMVILMLKLSVFFFFFPIFIYKNSYILVRPLFLELFSVEDFLCLLIVSVTN